MNPTLLLFLLVTTVAICRAAPAQSSEEIVIVEESLSHLTRRRPTFQSTGCDVSIRKDVGKPPPLLLQESGPLDVTGFVLPDEHGIIHLKVDQSIIVACPGVQNTLTDEFDGENEVTATCVSGTRFNVDGQEVELSSLSCSAYPRHDAVATSKTCYDGNMVINIGFNVSWGFLTTINVCFDKKQLGPLYSNTTVLADIAGHESGVERPSFLPGHFYGHISPNTQFKRATQRKTIGKVLGSTELGNKYISSNSDYYLARGHLAAKADFVYANEQRATFYYVNVAPQWQTFNGGNWNSLEGSVRALAAKRGIDLEVYTGTHGIASLPNVDGEETPLYLTAEETMPVPQFYWKVAYHRPTQSGVVCVGINNPYVTIAEQPDLQLCEDISEELDWLTWDAGDVKKGEGYCCEVDELRQEIPYLPKIDVKQLLT